MALPSEMGEQMRPTIGLVSVQRVVCFLPQVSSNRPQLTHNPNLDKCYDIKNKWMI